MSTPNTDELLRQGIEDVRNGNRAAARQKLEKVVDLDENNEKAWMWLASVVDTDEEKRICLGNVLHINPNNERARKALEALDERKQAAAPTGTPDAEVLPGITRRNLILIAGGGAAIVVVLLVILLASVAGGNAAAASATAQAVAVAATGTALSVDGTATAVAGTATQIAIAPPTLTLTPTNDRATLPPTWTLTPEPTITPTEAVLPPPSGLTGILAAWGGLDLENIGYFAVGVYNFNAGLQFQPVGNDIGSDPRLYPNGQRLTYTRYDRLLFGTSIDAINLNGQQVESLPDRWRGQQVIIQNPQKPVPSPDGTYIAFIGRTGEGRQQIFTLSLVDNTVRNLSNDNIDYSDLDISPDSSQIVAVRTDTLGGTGTDLAIIQVSTGGKFALTTDQDAFIETQPRWTTDGSQVYYAAAPQTEPNNYDIAIRSVTGGAPSLLVRHPANDQYPVLDPAGRFLAFSSDRSGNWEIYIFDLRTQSLSQLTNDPGPNYPGDWWQ